MHSWLWPALLECARRHNRRGSITAPVVPTKLFIFKASHSHCAQLARSGSGCRDLTVALTFVLSLLSSSLARPPGSPWEETRLSGAPRPAVFRGP